MSPVWVGCATASEREEASMGILAIPASALSARSSNRTRTSSNRRWKTTTSAVRRASREASASSSRARATSPRASDTRDSPTRVSAPNPASGSNPPDPRRLVGLVEGHPCIRATVLLDPLREQGRLAVARRRGDENQASLVLAFEATASSVRRAHPGRRAGHRNFGFGRSSPKQTGHERQRVAPRRESLRRSPTKGCGSG